MSAAETSRPRQAYWRALVAYVPPLLLTAVALNHVVLSRTSDLSPWKGGGFGMFATIDSPTRRTLLGHLAVGDRTVPIRLPADDPAARLVTQTITLPTPDRLDALAENLSRRQWYLDPATGIASPRRRQEGDETRIRPIALRVEISRILFTPATLEVEPLLLAEVTRDLR